MNNAEFDKFAEEYKNLLDSSVAASGESSDYFAEYKILDIAQNLEQAGVNVDSPLKFLDFGSGIGGSIPFVKQVFSKSDLTCLDVSRRSLEVASSRFPGMASFVSFDGNTIPFEDSSFDVAYAMCVFHHIDHKEHTALVRELRRVLRPGGMLFIFEHNPLNPLTVKVVNSCAFDENAVLIPAQKLKRTMTAAGFEDVAVRYRIFFPSSLRFLRFLEKALTWLPLGGQYYVTARKR